MSKNSYLTKRFIERYRKDTITIYMLEPFAHALTALKRDNRIGSIK
ncbi:hypothetical protein HXY32_06440 [Candidatus Bathyarchaeota archaeon]|nr:hypothetical protein [Candidatus Bathyarchaeota archaeon]